MTPARSVAAPAAERAAARRQHDAGDLAAGVGGGAQALVHGAVLGVDRHELGAGTERNGRTTGPAAIRLSLLASASRLPADNVAIVTGSPAKPTTALTTTSASRRARRGSTTVAHGNAAATSARRRRVADGDSVPGGTPWPGPPAWRRRSRRRGRRLRSGRPRRARRRASASRSSRTTRRWRHEPESRRWTRRLRRASRACSSRPPAGRTGSRRSDRGRRRGPGRSCRSP